MGVIWCENNRDIAGGKFGRRGFEGVTVDYVVGGPRLDDLSHNQSQHDLELLVLQQEREGRGGERAY